MQNNLRHYLQYCIREKLTCHKNSTKNVVNSFPVSRAASEVVEDSRRAAVVEDEPEAEHEKNEVVPAAATAPGIGQPIGCLISQNWCTFQITDMRARGFFLSKCPFAKYTFPLLYGVFKPKLLLET
jgi:hypothetical protein